MILYLYSTFPDVRHYYLNIIQIVKVRSYVQVKQPHMSDGLTKTSDDLDRDYQKII